MIGPSVAVMMAALSTGAGPTADTIKTIAGPYLYFGDRPSPQFRLEVTAEGRFAIFSQNLAVIEENRGAAEVRDGRLVLTPELPVKDLEARGFATRLVPIPSGGRFLLVAEGRAQAFCNLVNMGVPSTSVRWVAYVDERDKGRDFGVLRRPAVPPEWSPMLLKAPIEGRVVEVLSDRRARIDFGSDRGAMKDLVVWIDPDGKSAGIGKGLVLAPVVEVSPESSVIELKQPVDEWNRFRAGQRVFTRHPLADLAERLDRERQRPETDQSHPITPGRP